MNNCVYTALKEVLLAARTCREAQRCYFANRSKTMLVLARHCEHTLDVCIEVADYALLHGCSMPVQS